MPPLMRITPSGMRPATRRLAVPALTAAFFGVIAAPAYAPDHLMLANEVLPSATTSQQFVELKDPAQEPFPAASYTLSVHNGAGNMLGSQTFSPPYGFANDTRPYTVARSGTRDGALTVTLPAGTGQVCFNRGSGYPGFSPGPINCLGYGNVTNPVGGADVGPSPPAGQSVQRGLTTGSVCAAAPTRDAENSCGGSGGGGGGGGDDTTDPRQRIRVKRRQDVDRVTLFVRSNEDATLTVRASVSVPGAARTLRFRTVRRRLRANVRRRIRLRLTRRRKRAVKRALARGRRLRARVRLTARDGAGNASVRRVRIRLTN
jgi:hypothetical protein